jgi:hypothetical protein
MARARTNDELTSEQKRALRDAASSMERAYKEARLTLKAAGIRRGNPEGSTRCLQPPAGHCRAYQQPATGLRCKRCGHSFFRHDVF